MSDGMRQRGGLVFVSLLAVCSGIGCSSEGDPCSLDGQVTFNGRPLGDGDLRLDPIEGAPGPGGSARITDGRFQIPLDAGMLAGKHRVRITASRETGRIIRNDPPYPGEPPEFPEVVQYIPDRYNVNSELTLILGPGENTHGFAIKGREQPGPG